MKSKKYIIAGLSALSFAAPAFAADTVIEITGASAFRAAALNAIKAKDEDSGAAFAFGHDKAATTPTASSVSIFKGTFNGITGTTIVRCSFNGSVEGIRALLHPGATYNALYIPETSLTVTATVGGAEQVGLAGTEQADAEIAFSDVSVASTPEAALASSLEPATPNVGVVVFTMATNEGWDTPITNVTTNQFKALFSNGTQPLRLFTGVATDTGNNKLVFATGRNDGSGTRTTYLAETGYGFTKTVKQYVVNTSASGNMTQIQLVPQGGGSVPANASTVWGQDVDGNGGYSSGSTLVTDLALTGNNVQVLDE